MASTVSSSTVDDGNQRSDGPLSYAELKALLEDLRNKKDPAAAGKKNIMDRCPKKYKCLWRGKPGNGIYLKDFLDVKQQLEATLQKCDAATTKAVHALTPLLLATELPAKDVVLRSLTEAQVSCNEDRELYTTFKAAYKYHQNVYRGLESIVGGVQFEPVAPIEALVQALRSTTLRHAWCKWEGGPTWKGVPGSPPEDSCILCRQGVNYSLRLRSVGFGFGSRSVSVTLEAGKTTTIVGVSGSGKTVALLQAGGRDAATVYLTPEAPSMDRTDAPLRDLEERLANEPSQKRQNTDASDVIVELVREAVGEAVGPENLQLPKGTVVIAIDEIGATPYLQRVLCRTAVHKKITEAVGGFAGKTVHLVTAGTGGDTAANVGSHPGEFNYFNVRAAEDHGAWVLKRFNAMYPELFATLEGHRDAALMRALLHNARLAAIVADRLAEDKAFIERKDTIPADDIRVPYLSALFAAAVDRFAQLNGLKGRSLAGIRKALADALAICWGGYVSIEEDDRQQLVTQYGLLADTAVLRGSLDEFVRIKHKAQPALFVRKGSPRYKLYPEGFAMLLVAFRMHVSGGQERAAWEQCEVAAAQWGALLALAVPAGESLCSTFDRVTAAYSEGNVQLRPYTDVFPGRRYNYVHLNVSRESLPMEPFKEKPFGVSFPRMSTGVRAPRLSAGPNEMEVAVLLNRAGAAGPDVVVVTNSGDELLLQVKSGKSRLSADNLRTAFESTGWKSEKTTKDTAHTIPLDYVENVPKPGKRRHVVVLAGRSAPELAMPPEGTPCRVVKAQPSPSGLTHQDLLVFPQFVGRQPEGMARGALVGDNRDRAEELSRPAKPKRHRSEEQKEEQ